MKFLELKATGETLDMKRGGVITYDTDVTTEGPGVIMLDNPTGEYGVTLISQYHPGGQVKVVMKAVMTPAKKYDIGQVVARLAVF